MSEVFHKDICYISSLIKEVDKVSTTPEKMILASEIIDYLSSHMHLLLILRFRKVVIRKIDEFDRYCQLIYQEEGVKKEDLANASYRLQDSISFLRAVMRAKEGR